MAWLEDWSPSEKFPAPPREFQNGLKRPKWGEVAGNALNRHRLPQWGPIRPGLPSFGDLETPRFRGFCRSARPNWLVWAVRARMVRESAGACKETATAQD